MSNRTKLQNKEHVIEALYRAKFKFPGRQKIHISKKWGFTKFNGDEFENMVAEKNLEGRSLTCTGHPGTRLFGAEKRLELRSTVGVAEDNEVALDQMLEKGDV
ncbi:hypothetical protein CB1_001592004 [Camelus ferus]|nr:hypothetical protein CB1_001592004 [Camelus ferus]